MPRDDGDERGCRVVQGASWRAGGEEEAQATTTRNRVVGDSSQRVKIAVNGEAGGATEEVGGSRGWGGLQLVGDLQEHLEFGNSGEGGGVTGGVLRKVAGQGDLASCHVSPTLNSTPLEDSRNIGAFHGHRTLAKESGVHACAVSLVCFCGIYRATSTENSTNMQARDYWINKCNIHYENHPSGDLAREPARVIFGMTPGRDEEVVLCVLEQLAHQAPEKLLLNALHIHLIDSSKSVLVPSPDALRASNARA
ncbi:hypothetical protein AJ80_07286 [Polytolypa hystricis UAMH7299]|uniref:Uncharacterized protein n=1 Tax=Polytolypa hystricis (strain UAMH7299) TaxID=1447883 RepID=A0A2B7XR61_POLH7|nr:hypothetical protein AJ80_07286 [Polytolypa hystricis UAMH7299]